MPTYSGVWSLPSVYQAVAQGQWPYSPTNGSTGLFGGGFNTTNVIDRVTIESAGNATDFGDLTQARYYLGACSSSTRGIWGGGTVASASNEGVNTLDYVTIATAGDATDFGDLTQVRYYVSGTSNSTRGLFGGGVYTISNTNTIVNIIDYITIASAGNATDFGDLTLARNALSACASSTRGLFGGGTTGAATNTIDYITIASTGNATDFGDLTTARSQLAGCASATRGVFGGGNGPSNVIDYVTIASTGNATDFGDLTVARNVLSSCSSTARGLFGGGNAAASNTIDYITIATTGNATDFGDLTVGRYGLAACSNAHGGLA